MDGGDGQGKQQGIIRAKGIQHKTFLMIFFLTLFHSETLLIMAFWKKAANEKNIQLAIPEIINCLSLSYSNTLLCRENMRATAEEEGSSPAAESKNVYLPN